MNTTSLPFVLGIVLAQVVGCEKRDRTAAGSYDAGNVVHNSLAADLPQWRIPIDSPTVVIGASDNPDYDFERFPRTIRLSDGRLVTADQSSTWKVKVYSPTGRLVKKLSAGGGPDEIAFGYTEPVSTSGDTIVFWHAGNAPMEVMSPTFVRLRTVGRLPGADGRLKLHDRLSDGTWVVTRLLMDSLYNGAPKSGSELPLRWMTWNTDTTEKRSILVYSQTEFWEPSRLFPRVTAFRIRGPLGYFAYNEQPEIEIRDTSGTVIRRIRVDLPKQRVSRADVETFLAERAVMKGNPPPTAAAIAGLPAAEYFPYFESLHVTPTGMIWALLYRKRPLGDDSRFLVFSPDGKLVAVATMPGGNQYHLADVQDDSIVLVVRDSDDNYLVKVVNVVKSR